MAYQSEVKFRDFHPDTQAFFDGKRVLVTGGGGFIGSHVVEQLLELKAQPVVLGRKINPPFLAGVADRIEFRQCDLQDPVATMEAVKGVQVVLHMAAMVAGLEFNAKHPATIFHGNVSSFLNVILAAQKNRVERFLVTSSACVYPRFCSIPTPESEGTKDEPEPTNSGYGWAKRVEEYVGAQYFKEHGLPVAIARPYNSYGPRDNFDPASSHVIPALIVKAFQAEKGEFKVWGDGSHTRSFLYVDDFARGCIEIAARYPKGEPLNLGAAEEITIRETAELVAQFAGELRGEKIRPVFDAQGLTGQPRRMCDTTKIETELQFKAKEPFREGLRKTVEWFYRNR